MTQFFSDQTQLLNMQDLLLILKILLKPFFEKLLMKTYTLQINVETKDVLSSNNIILDTYKK